MSILDMFDFLTNSIKMPIGALMTCILISFFIKPQTVIEEVSLSGEFKEKTLFSVVIRYVAPICILVILVSAVLSTFGVIRI
jgi:NSS family neurotransmitter:Na+ symporter